MAGPGGLHLLEVDASQGKLRDDGGIWLRTRSGNTKASDSTRDVAEVKARHLTAALRRAAAGRFLTVPRYAGRRSPVIRVRPSTSADRPRGVCSAPTSRPTPRCPG
ncbi:hypothetical protein [Streptomyces sp. NPDC093937]|uniref:hypothetical protein n=1 Tax=Streptomyces sp. NPDC093937 TaxID=3161016 RepID=UPI00342B9137